MARKKQDGSERLDVNILVPFAGSMAEEVKTIARANGMPNTMIIRMVTEIGLEEIRKGRELKLVVPKGNHEVHGVCEAQ